MLDLGPARGERHGAVLPTRDAARAMRQAAETADRRQASALVLDSLRPLGIVRRHRRGQPVFAEGDAALHWYWLSSGAVEVCGIAECGRRHVAELVLPGDFFGLEACEVRGASAEVTRDAVLLAFPRAGAERRMDDDATLARAFRQLACLRLHEVQSRLLRLGRMTALGRVASFLLEMAERRQRGLTDVVEIPVTRDGIADYLGLKAETVSRALTELRRRGAISLPARQSIRLADRDALTEAQGIGR